jgi:hypothetical protein
MRLTLRTLLAYLDDTLPPDQAHAIGLKVAESEYARDLMERIRKVTRRRGLSTPGADGMGSAADPNTVAEYLSDALPGDALERFEKTCLDSDVHLAEVAACHQILTLLLSEPVRVPPTARQRMYALVKGKESLPKRKPGKTLPVGGEMPDEPAAAGDDDDAAFLLGLSAYSPEEPPGRRAAKAGLLAGLTAALAAAVWLGWPRGAADTGHRPEVAAVAPPAKPPEPKPEEKPPARAEEKPKPEEKGKPAEAEAPKPPEPKAEERPKGELAPETPKPREDRAVVGRLDNPEAVVLAEPAADRWVRVVRADPGVPTAVRLLAIPGYKGKLSLDAGLAVELWGNLPEQFPGAPLLESAVTVYAPPDGFDADLAVHAGRVYLQSRKPGGGKVRLRIDAEAWDLALPDEKAEVAVEVIRSLVRGLSADLDRSERPETQAAVAVLRGKVALKVRYKDVPVAAGELVAWTNKGAGLAGPRKLGDGAASAYFAKFQPYRNEADAKGVQQALNDLANGFTQPDAVRVKFAELLDDSAAPSAQSYFRGRLGVFGSAAIGDLPTLVDALIDGRRPFVRDAAVAGLTALLPRTPDGTEAFRKQVAAKGGLTDEQAGQAVRLLRGPTDAERADPEVLDKLADQLGSRNPPVLRELAFWVLRNQVDPDAYGVPALTRVDLNGPPEKVDEAKAAWKRRVDDLKKKMVEPKS